MKNTLFIKASEIAEGLGVSKAYAYKILRELNAELQKKGYMVIAGRVNRKYFEEKLFGMSEVAEMEEKSGSL